MAFTNRILLIVPGFGQPVQNDALFLSAGTTITTAGSPQTITLGSLVPALKNGWVRVKLYGATVAITITVCTVVATDGTIFVWLGNFTPTPGVALSTVAGAAGNPYVNNGTAAVPGGLELLFPFLTDLAITQFSVVLTMTGGGGTAKADIDIGATN